MLTVNLVTQGRKGKVVTTIDGFEADPETLAEIARELKRHCGAGGTVRGRTIEIQGDQRERVRQKLREMGF